MSEYLKNTKIKMAYFYADKFTFLPLCHTVEGAYALSSRALRPGPSFLVTFLRSCPESHYFSSSSRLRMAKRGAATIGTSHS